MDGYKLLCTFVHFFFFIQLGTFRSPEGEYFVEPLHSYQGEHYEEEHTKPHVVYRKSAPKKLTSGENSACDTSGMMHNMISMHTFYTDEVSQMYTQIDTNIHRCNLRATAHILANTSAHMHSYCTCNHC